MGVYVRALGASVAMGALVLLSGCGDGGSATAAQATTLRLGYFPNLTHAAALVGVQDGTFAKKLAPAKLETRTFKAGPEAVEALFSGALDAAYLGPGPATNAFAKSKGEAIRVIAGATSGGAALVVRFDIATAEDLRGKKIGTPQLGNTQDVALRAWLKDQGLTSTKEGGGDVAIVPQENSQTVDTFASGVIDGAWVPEPFVTRLVDKGAKVLVDERTLWPGGKFVTTHLVVRTAFLKEHPDIVTRLLEAHVAVTDKLVADPAAAQRTVGEAIGALTGKPLDPGVITRAWRSLTFTVDPLPASLLTGARHATDAGLLEPVDGLERIYDLAPLNAVLGAAGKPSVAGP